MTGTILWSVVAAVIVVVVVIVVVAVRVRARARAAAVGAPRVHRVARECAALGHVYRFHGTGLRCVRCGNHVARVDGELYGRVEDGRIDRRREPR